MTNKPDFLERVQFSTISEALDYAAETEKGVYFYSHSGELEHAISYRQMRDRAMEMAQKLNTLKLERYSHIGLVAETHPDFLLYFFACQYAGLLPCPLPYINLGGGKDVYVESLSHLGRKAKLAAILGPQDLLDCLQQASTANGARALSYDALKQEEAQGAIAPLTPDEPAYIQYSSGSTSDPKGVWITQHAITSNIAMILKNGSRSRTSDRTFSWLPFFHDMGLVGMLLTPMFGISSVDYIAPSAFARNPLLWIRLMSENKSTVTYAPSFAYALAAKYHKTHPAHYDLSHLRLAGIGGDMVRPNDLEEFALGFTDCGFREENFLPSYGMSEAVLGIAFDDYGQKPFVHSLVKGGRQLVSCGRPLPGIDLIIVDDKGADVPELVVGHIWVRAPDLMTRYFEDEAATQASMRRDGYRDTGDMGYLVEGRLMITGRAKELILWRGRNIWPQDIELIVERLDPLSLTAAAFSVEDNEEEKIVVLVQSKDMSASEQDTRVQQITSGIFATLGVSAHIVFVPLATIPLTPSGKIARLHARDYYLKTRSEK